MKQRSSKRKRRLAVGWRPHRPLLREGTSWRGLEPLESRLLLSAGVIEPWPTDAVDATLPAPAMVLSSVTVLPVVAAQEQEHQPVTITEPLLILTGHTDNIRNANFSADGQRLLTHARSDGALLWDVASGELLGSFAPPGTNSEGAALSPDAMRVALASGVPRGVFVYDAATGEEVFSLTGQLGAGLTRVVAFAPTNSNLVAAGLIDGAVQLIDLDAGEIVRTFTGSTGAAASLAFSPDGSLLVMGTPTNSAFLWNVATGELVQSFIPASRQGSLNSIGITPDNEQVYSTKASFEINAWDVSTGDPLPGVAPSALGLAVSPDGGYLGLGAGLGVNSRLWDLTHQRVHRVFEDGGGGLAVAFSPDGERVAISASQTMYIWPTGLSDNGGPGDPGDPQDPGEELPDLIIEAVSYNTGSIATGDNLMLQVEVANLGEADVPADTGITVSVQLSPDRNWDGEHNIILDVPASWLHIAGLDVEQIITFDQAALPIPVDALPGGYHLGVQVETVNPLDEADATNNLWWSQQPDIDIIGAFVDVGLFRLHSPEGFAAIGPDGQTEAVSSQTLIGLIPSAGAAFAPLVRVEGELVYDADAILAGGTLHAAALDLGVPIWTGTAVWQPSEPKSQSLFLQGLYGELVSPAGLQLIPQAIALTEAGLVVTGELELPQLLGSHRLSLEAEQALLIAADGIRLAGTAATLTAGPFQLSTSIRLNEIQLSYDWNTDAFRGAASVTIPDDLTFDGFIELLNGRVDGIGVDVDGVNIPLPRVAKLRLTRLAGGVQNLQSGTPLFSAGLGLASGPTVTVNLPPWAGGFYQGSLMEASLDAQFDANHLTATGDLTLQGGIITGNGSFNLNWDPVHLELDATFSILAGIVQTTARLHANSDLDFNLHALASIHFPNLLPIIGGKTITSANVLVQYRSELPAANSFITGWTEVNLPFDHTIAGGFLVRMDGSWELVGSEELAQAQQAAPLAAPLTSGGPVAFMAMTEIDDSHVTSFDVQPGTSFALFETRWEVPTDRAELDVRLVSPNGEAFDLATIAEHPGIAIVEALSDELNLVLIVDAPQAGAWDLILRNGAALGEVTTFAVSPLTSPTIALHDPERSTGAPQPTYRFDVADAPQDSVVHLYYDDVGEGYEGVLLAGDLPVVDGGGSYTWDAQMLPDGTYHVYAVVVAPGHAPVFSEYSEALVVPLADLTPPPTVTFGNGAAKSVTYTDADGTTATVQLKGGLGTLHFTGDIDDIEDTKKGIIVTGTNVAVSQVVIEDASSASLTVKLKDGDGRVTWGGLTADGSVKSIKARNVDITGDVAIAGLLGGADLGHLVGPGTFTTGGSAADKGGKIIVQQIEEFSFNTSAPIGSFTAATWLDRDGEPDELRAASLGKVAIAQAMEANIVATDSTAKSAIKQLAVGGWLDGAMIDAAGHVGKVTLGGMRHSQLRMGLNAGITSLPTTAGAFVNQSATLKSMTITGAVQESGASFIESLIAGWNMGNIKLGVVATDSGETDSLGIAARTIKAVDYTADGTRTAMKKLAGPADDLVSGDFVLRLV